HDDRVGGGCQRLPDPIGAVAGDVEPGSVHPHERPPLVASGRSPCQPSAREISRDALSRCGTMRSRDSWSKRGSGPQTEMAPTADPSTPHTGAAPAPAPTWRSPSECAKPTWRISSRRASSTERSVTVREVSDSSGPLRTASCWSRGRKARMQVEELPTYSGKRRPTSTVILTSFVEATWSRYTRPPGTSAETVVVSPVSS